MPSRSKKQQRFFGLVHAYQKGDIENVSPEVKKVASEIDYEDARKFAKTKHKGLPEKVRKRRKRNENSIINFTKFLNEERVLEPTYIYILIYVRETDGDCFIEKHTIEEIKSIIEKYRLSSYDYAIIDGDVIKTFDSKIDLNSL